MRVLLLVYARCIVGQDTIAKQRIDAALAATNGTERPSVTVEASRTQPPLSHRPPDTDGPSRSQPDTPTPPTEPLSAPDLGL
ncbi:conserved hypothetical protein [Frankia canadensis]|uniref:Uncharacterized protein n=1 Tax=Frankia canadensis TaxID=1836972 RepID=A0A2I2L266_9ACTN|nr:conserved hypothetical protein [Frankia canadensis]SOU59288.1 conserved hypothetical protein [Frankia canadensis]